eukprot:CAMPEP_0167740782 /NCGR_PEP_ID=MMETSP0110_2-20121227/486_1 /TAXON_ID=629695 /ORGANISM="Gymnochlora sp., Strain CCMP2014" /LENGTH=438 /DNA_ID=CAMNT_0007624749 /DNA_START=97 /DNA_END=1413 /DNA_ORIENTATION=-
MAFDSHNGIISRLFDVDHCESEKMEQDLQSLGFDDHYRENKVISTKSGQFLIPGFIDGHIHAPQYSYTGTGLDKPLLQWLDQYTFPVEESFKDPSIARERYEQVVTRAVSEGTTTAMYFATIHVEGAKILADILHEKGQRGFVGLVSMDINPGVPEYGQHTDAALDDAESFVSWIQQQKEISEEKRVLPVLTPRYIPTCSVELLSGLGDIARRHDVHVQSHVAESLDVIEEIERQHPGVRDVELFDRAGLLTPKTVLAHGVHLTDEELTTLKENGSSIAHCPLSNLYFANGFLDVRRLMKSGVGLTLGSDVAGGYSISMLDSMRTAIMTYRAVQIMNGERPSPTEPPEINHATAFYMATLGGARAMGIGEQVGSFAQGKKFDALMIDTTVGGNIDPLVVGIGQNGTPTPQEEFERFVHLGDGRNILSVWVDGKVCASQ